MYFCDTHSPIIFLFSQILKGQNLTVTISEDKTAILTHKQAEDTEITLLESACCHRQSSLLDTSSLVTTFLGPSPHIIPPSLKICNSVLSSSWSYFSVQLGLSRENRKRKREKRTLLAKPPNALPGPRWTLPIADPEVLAGRGVTPGGAGHLPGWCLLS